MARNASVTRDEIVSAALAAAKRDGTSALGIRQVASACGVSVGTIYNYFPDKSALVIEVTAAYWTEVLAPWLERPQDTGLADSCKQLTSCLSGPLSEFEANWLEGVESVEKTARDEGKQEEHALTSRVIRSLAQAAEHDPSISSVRLEAFGARRLALFCWVSILGAIRSGADTTETLTALLSMALDEGRKEVSQAHCPKPTSATTDEQS